MTSAEIERVDRLEREAYAYRELRDEAELEVQRLLIERRLILETCDHRDAQGQSLLVTRHKVPNYCTLCGCYIPEGETP